MQVLLLHRNHRREDLGVEGIDPSGSFIEGGADSSRLSLLVSPCECCGGHQFTPLPVLECLTGFRFLVRSSMVTHHQASVITQKSDSSIEEYGSAAPTALHRMQSEWISVLRTSAT
jgi:hypothetical protein